jgi:hypothetical protein
VAKQRNCNLNQFSATDKLWLLCAPARLKKKMALPPSRTRKTETQALVEP